ncbi:AAA family ATPase [Bifidobacterium catulorum]|nr:AAA family ATPase [Bifidobacterium catulorum]
MRLIGMRFMGIGPYDGEYSIDFAALSRSHIFLIEGETGSGKSTILDCISFALYGAVSSDDASKDRLRSRFLDTDPKASFVDLIFEIDGSYYRVRRQPQFERRKRRGEGTMTENAKGTLWKIDAGLGDLVRATAAGESEPDGGAQRYFDYAEAAGNSETLASQARDTGVEVIRLLHLNRDQFSKTVMLAQGQFSGFLKCKPEERTRLIKDLFSADIYERIQTILDTMRKQRSADMDRRRDDVIGMIDEAKDNADRIDALAVECGTIAGDDDADADADNGIDADGGTAHDAAWCLTDGGDLNEPAMSPDDIVAAIGSRLRQVAETSDATLARCRATLQTTADALAAARERLDVGLRLRSLAEAEQTAVKRRGELKARDDDMRQARERVERSRKAEPVVQAQRECTALSVQRGSQERRLGEYRERLARYDAADVMAAAREQALRKAAERPVAEAALDAATTLRERLRKAEAARKEASEAVENAERNEQRVAQTTAALGSMESADAVNERLQDVIRQEGSKDRLAERLDEARNRLRHARLREEAASKLRELEDAALLAGRRHHEAEAAYAKAEAAQRTAGAAAFAALLADGEPCPVCGAVDHPAPAIVPADEPDAAQITRLGQTVSEALAAFEAAKSAVVIQNKTLDTEAELAHGLDVAQAQAAVAALQAELDAAEGLAQRHRLLSEQLLKIRAAEQDDAQARQALEIARNNAENARRLADAAIELCIGADGAPATPESVQRQEQKAREAINECERQQTIAERIAERIDQRAALEKQTAEAESALRTLGEQLETSLARLSELADANRFADADAARIALLPEQEAARLKQAIDDHDTQMSVVTADLARIRGEFADLAQSAQAKRLFSDESSDLADESSDPADDFGMGVIDIMAIVTMFDETAERRRLAVAEQAHEAAIRAEEQARGLDEARRRRTEALTAGLRDWAKAGADYAPVRDMALLAGGKAGSLANDGLSLVTYAVTERFRDVLDRANEILKDIRGGVYELRLGTHEGRTARTGLPIEVFDRRSERSTEATTLSGGETFFVSLALSLALADIIQAENGGISMDTLFIDEGFGSLSDDYLDDVIDVLRSISRTRDIGVISHVGRLKDQIAERISVTRINEDSASRLTVVV